MQLLTPEGKVVLGVTGGWLAIMAPAVVTLALRLREFNASGVPATYALILALGWLTMILALIVSGSWGDTAQRRFSTRRSQARIAVPLIAAGGVLLAIAPSPAWLATAWVAVQIPSAIIITTALADGGRTVAPDRRGLTSGLVGAAPIMALLFGGIAVRVLGDSLTWAFVIPALVGALVAAPLMHAGAPSGLSPEANEDQAISQWPSKRSRTSLWMAFLVGSFLLSCSTSTTNGFLVTFVQYVTAVSPDEISDLSSLAVIIAAILAAAASVTAGALTDGKAVSIRLWILACALCSVALAALLAAPTATTVLIAASVFGIAFGAANGVEFTVVLLVRRERERLGRDFGLFTALTSAPYVLVPIVAAALLSERPAEAMVRLFALACVTAAMGALVVSTVVIRQSRRVRPVAEFAEPAISIN